MRATFARCCMRVGKPLIMSKLNVIILVRSAFFNKTPKSTKFPIIMPDLDLLFRSFPKEKTNYIPAR